MKKTVFLIMTAVIASFFVLSVQRSEAVPSYARQLEKPCTACHTIWPNLNQYGRQFKVKAYTDASPDWDVVSKDRLNLFYIFPISARIMFIPYQIEQDHSAATAGSVNSTYNVNQTFIDNMQIFLAGRIYRYAGLFTSVESGAVGGSGNASGNFSLAVAKFAFAYPLSNGNTLGLVLFHGQSTSADPFDSLGGWDRDIATPDTEGLPWVLSKGWTSSFWSGNSRNGATVHGYFLGNQLYAALSVMRGSGVSDADFFATTFMHQLSNPLASPENASTGPVSGYARVAWDQKLSNGAATFGGIVYTGQERVTSTAGVAAVPFITTRINRQYLDASLEQNFGTNNLVEAKAIYGFGQESGLTGITNGTAALGSGDKRNFNGGSVEADYFFRRTYGIVGQYNWVTNFKVQPQDFDPATSQHTWLVGLNYLPWLNTKVQFIYANTRSNYLTGGTVTSGPSETDKIYKFMVDVAF
ncbi:MAG: hypothetical protein M0Z61_00400 [Nitrospiraceae bacterium]|nr:hypothetical protein [Nitrospiraceae bacterium]